MVLALALYLLMLRLIDLSGNSYRMQLNDYIRTMFANLAASVSGRGLPLDIVSILLVAGVAVAERPVMQAGLPSRLVHPGNAPVISAPILVALSVSKLLDIGRVVMPAAPLHVISATGSLAHWSRWCHGFARPRDVLALPWRTKVRSGP